MLLVKPTDSPSIKDAANAAAGRAHNSKHVKNVMAEVSIIRIAGKILLNNRGEIPIAAAAL